jgi:catalase (peroxidase I)
LANRCGDYIYYVPEKHAYGMLAAGAFRPIRTHAQIEREDLEDLLTRASASGLTVKSLVSCIIASGYRLER